MSVFRIITCRITGYTDAGKAYQYQNGVIYSCPAHMALSLEQEWGRTDVGDPREQTVERLKGEDALTYACRACATPEQEELITPEMIVSLQCELEAVGSKLFEIAFQIGQDLEPQNKALSSPSGLSELADFFRRASIAANQRTETES